MILKDARLFVAHFVEGEYTPEEYATFLQWLQDASIDELGIIADEHEALFERWSLPAVNPSSEWVNQLEQKLDEQEKLAPIRKLRTGGFSLKPVWVAAASVLLLSTGGYFWYNYNRSAEKQSGIVKSGAEVLYAAFSVPRGGEQQAFVLADGSKIWLNAASTLRYPVNFGGDARTVELSGEGYFEVTGSAARPFHVRIKGAEIEVLGTHFNVKAYEDESMSQTTLVDGAVIVF
jgi:ferric-dicitrate binding protein FerR (iron transport regulator)